MGLDWLLSGRLDVLNPQKIKKIIVKGVNEVKDNSGIVWILGELKEILFE